MRRVPLLSQFCTSLLLPVDLEHHQPFIAMLPQYLIVGLRNANQSGYLNRCWTDNEVENLVDQLGAFGCSIKAIKKKRD